MDPPRPRPCPPPVQGARPWLRPVVRGTCFMRIAWFALSIAAMLSMALAFYPALWLPVRRRRALLTISGMLILLSPLLVPPPARFLRLLASILAVVFTIKLYDLHVGASSGQRPP